MKLRDAVSIVVSGNMDPVALSVIEAAVVAHEARCARADHRFNPEVEDGPTFHRNRTALNLSESDKFKELRRLENVKDDG